MKPPLKDRRPPLAAPPRDGTAARLTLIGGAGTAAAPRQDPAPIVHLPVGAGRQPSLPPVVVEAEFHLKRFRGGHVEDERYAATLYAPSDAPAALLAALANAAGEIEELVRVGAPDDHLVLSVSIRR